MDESAHELLSHVGALRRYGLLLARDRDVAEDLVQESLLRALLRREAWAGARNPRSYLMSILHNLWIDQLRRRRHEPDTVPIDDVAWKLGYAPVQHGRAQLRDLAAALGRLPGEQRSALIQVGLEGKSYREAAAALGLPIGTVMSRLSRGRGTLRRELDREAS